MGDVAELLSADCHLTVIAPQEVVQFQTFPHIRYVLEPLGPINVDRELLQSCGDGDAKRRTAEQHFRHSSIGKLPLAADLPLMAQN